MTMPNFLIIGAAKSGTTSVYRYLAEHPQIYMSPQKQADFFAFEGKKPNYNWPRNGVAHVNRTAITDIGAYQALFEGVADEVGIGEASPLYLYIPSSAERIRDHVPGMKLIAILRHPVERAYSNFNHLRRDGDEPFSDFTQAFRAEEARIRSNWAPFWHYKQMSLYHGQLKRYYDLFDRGRIRVYLYEDLKADPLGVLKDIFRFLEVDDAFVPDMSKKYNTAHTYRIKALGRFLAHANITKSILKSVLPKELREYLTNSVRRLGVVPGKAPLSSETRRELTQEFREDILKLQSLIQRDLAHWLK